VTALITGGGGQLAQALQMSAPAGRAVRALSHAELDIADAAAVQQVMRTLQPQLVINAAAFTRVDEAEVRPEAAERVNATGPAVLAAACRASGAWLLHVSTDYVFDGAHSRPYTPLAEPRPLSVYGRTKLAGERAVQAALGAGSTLVRTSWLYSGGHRNFLTTMLPRLAAPGELRVIADQVGAPTAVSGLARVLWALAERRAGGLFHWCDSGVASWYDFAVAIAEESRALQLLHAPAVLIPITSAEYPLPAARPPYSLLDKSATEQLLGVRAAHWRVALRETLSGLAPDRAPQGLAERIAPDSAGGRR
jgi:dTDP-4-dehydrorhamnose reductase